MNSNPSDLPLNNRQLLFNELCYEVFFNTDAGKRLLILLETKHFRQPVAIPGKDPSFAFFNEGMNELIRSFSASAQTHLHQAQTKKAPKKPII